MSEWVEKINGVYMTINNGNDKVRINPIVSKLKESNMRRNSHQVVVMEFQESVKQYFLKKYDTRVNVLLFGNTFGLENDSEFYMTSMAWGKYKAFEFSIQVLYDFCKEFGCEFEKTTCDGDRYIFYYKDDNGFKEEFFSRLVI